MEQIQERTKKFRFTHQLNETLNKNKTPFALDECLFSLEFCVKRKI